MIIKKIFATILLTSLICPLLKGQVNEVFRSVASSTMISIGASDILDTYLTPLDYKGLHLGVINERLQVAGYGNDKWYKQQYVWLDLSSNDNQTNNGLVMSGFVGYSWGTLYNFLEYSGLRISAGPYISGETGFIYNVRNGNNPASAKFDINLGASLMATYKLKYFRKFPITIRYQASLPVVGAFFSPHYEQSYYEIFVVGNSSGIVKCGYWGNGFDMKNIFTIDLPLASMNLRIGYENKIFNSNVNHIKNRRVSNSFLIGFSKEFLPFNRKKPKIQVDNIVNPIF